MDGKVSFLLGQAGESDGGRRLGMVYISLCVLSSAVSELEKSLGRVIRTAQTYLWRGKGRGHSSTAGEPEHVCSW